MHPFSLAALGAGLLLATAPEVPLDPTRVCPLPIGSEVPSVGVRDIDGNERDLREIVAAQPTILIFYRGGW